MSAVRTAAGALLRSRDRATSVLTVAAFALPHAFLLAVTGGVMAFGARAAVAATSATADDPSSLDGMASFYVILAYFAATLLVVPIISMGAAAARLGMSRRERDLAVLRLVGLAPGKTKLACILETCVFAVVGVVVGSILYAVTLPAWGALSFQGRPMGAGEMWVGVVALLVEGLAMILLAALSSWLAMRTVAITPLGVARRTQAGRVSAVGPVLGAVSTAVNQPIRVLDSADQVRALSSMGSPRGFTDRSRRLRGNRPAASPHPRERTRGTRVTLFSVDACPGLGLIPLDEAGADPCYPDNLESKNV